MDPGIFEKGSGLGCLGSEVPKLGPEAKPPWEIRRPEAAAKCLIILQSLIFSSRKFTILWTATERGHVTCFTCFVKYEDVMGLNLNPKPFLVTPVGGRQCRQICIC